MPIMTDKFFLTCEVCGLEEDEDSVDENWIAFSKPNAFEVLVCTECAGSKEKLTEAFKAFMDTLDIDKLVKH
jgi:hypothetical protein